MSLLNQTWDTSFFNSEYDFDEKVEYPTLRIQFASMDVIKSLLIDSPFPAFIAEIESGSIYFANNNARTIIPNTSFDGNLLSDYIFTTEGVFKEQLCTFGKKWYLYKETAFANEQGSYLIIELRKRIDVPDSETLESWKKMIEVVVHRFRSPMTGISGYFEMLEADINKEENRRWLQNIYSGINRIFTMMDELEQLYHISTNFKGTDKTFQNILPIIQQSILTLPSELQNRVKFEQPNNPVEFNFDQESLKCILDRLLHNAAIHSDKTSSKITISIGPGNALEIKNSSIIGSKELSFRIFDPFVTTRSDGMGIGLTMALLYAQQFGGTLKLLENNAKNEVSFFILFPDK